MHLDLGMQDSSLLPPDRSEAPVGASNNGVQDADADFGRRAVEAIVGKVEERVRDLLDHWYGDQGHGAPV